jgi:selenide,water dikinase
MSTHESVVLGFDGADDAAAVRLKDGKLLIQTVDFFTPIVDEPYEFGQIAAANSLSDIYAMGGEPLFALNIVGFPINDLPKAILTEILQGGVDKAAEAGIPIVGGHSVDDKEPKYGLVVTGEVDESKMWKNSGAEAGDVLVLTKPLGTGVIATAIKKGTAPQKSIDSVVQSMAALNKNAADHLKELDVHAVTDVTGFGLLGHLKEMCQNSGVSSEINFSKLNFLPSVFDLAQSGIMAGGTRRNLDYVKDFVSFGPNLTELEHLLAADAQTSGGLLISLPDEDAQKFIQSYGPPSSIIGHIKEKSSHLITLF